jgi:hypothetical protein
MMAADPVIHQAPVLPASMSTPKMSESRMADAESASAAWRAAA